MSLAIDVDKVEAVLLADGWHKVHKFSFFLDAYEYVWKDYNKPVYYSQYGRECTGFEFQEMVSGKLSWTKGPMEALLAVREVSKAILVERRAAQAKKQAEDDECPF